MMTRIWCGITQGKQEQNVKNRIDIRTPMKNIFMNIMEW